MTWVDHQPIVYPNHSSGDQAFWFARIRQEPEIVSPEEVMVWWHWLRGVRSGDAPLLHAGLCAERFQNRCVVGLAAQAQGLRALAQSWGSLLLGRIAGQWCKPRSELWVPGASMKSNYRGDLVHAFHPSTQDWGEPDPARMGEAVHASRHAVESLRSQWHGLAWGCSHEWLHSAYERSWCRQTPYGVYHAGCHVPWLGVRTARRDAVHVRDIANIFNPVAIKVGPDHSVMEVLAVVRELLNAKPDRPILLIHRFPVDALGERLPELLLTLHDEAPELLWLCDPMHGNTRRYQGRKWRSVSEMARCVERALHLHAQVGVPCHGLHLEVSAWADGECFESQWDRMQAQTTRSPMVDPQLSIRQAGVFLQRVWPR